ncbi:hypothetical protein Celaphus_00018880 [Cervus elaphus hippelaphus]|uniref:Uncharacterized protein n=1 Tax=Cervus elaphus hippelaphus TaxID=46360 RepID=A0A212C5M4_CEREH|nr:hypothetical protein Celaphus_00018880 [Cervus elaphus hippelaphus]
MHLPEASPAAGEGHPQPAPLKNIYLLEFHPSLGLASCIPRALEHLLREARHTWRPTSASAFTLLERRVLQLALDVWLTPARPESWYSAQLQKDVGSLKGLVDQKIEFRVLAKEEHRKLP